MSRTDNFIHQSDENFKIKIFGLEGIERALNRIANELEKSNNQTGKHYKEDKFGDDE